MKPLPPVWLDEIPGPLASGRHADHRVSRTGLAGAEMQLSKTQDVATDIDRTAMWHELADG